MIFSSGLIRIILASLFAVFPPSALSLYISLTLMLGACQLLSRKRRRARKTERGKRTRVALQLWEILKEAITVCTGLSPAVFFTVVTLGLALYHVVAQLFRSSPARTTARSVDESVKLLPLPVQVSEISEEELQQYDGSDPYNPLLMAIKGQIYDVSQSGMFYGPGGPYALFVGRDVSRALGKLSFEKEDLIGDISGLNPFELDALQDWEYKFMSKYVKVGTVKKNDDGCSPNEPAEAPTDRETPARDAEVVEKPNAEPVVEVTLLPLW